MDAQVRSTDTPVSRNGSGVRPDFGFPPEDAPPAATAQRFDPRTRVLLEGPITSTLLRLATPNVLVMFNSLASVIRGTGNMAVPAVVTSVGAAALIPLSPCLIFGWGPFPRLGIAGGALAVIVFYVIGSIALVAYLRAGRSVVRLSFVGVRLRWPLFRDILQVGAVAALITVQTSLTIAIATGFVGRFGPAAIAGYGTGSNPPWAPAPTSSAGHGPCGLEMSCGPRARSSRCDHRGRVQIRG